MNVLLTSQVFTATWQRERAFRWIGLPCMRWDGAGQDPGPDQSRANSAERKPGREPPAQQFGERDLGDLVPRTAGELVDATAAGEGEGEREELKAMAIR